MPWEGPSIPKDPANFDPENKYADRVAYFQHREAIVAEEFVKVAEAKLIRKKLKKCYKEAGVNYMQDCRELAEQYLASIKGTGFYRANSGPNDPPKWEAFGVHRE